MLPVHFLTIVLNGEPFIRHHLEVFRRLPFPWRWHIVEGVAELVNDSSWCARRGGRVPADRHRDGRSSDGTTGYLDRIAAEEPERVALYRKPPGVFWQGKVEMVRAPLAAMTEECLLWQVDADELWTAAQIVRAHRLFQDHPGRSAALYLCHFFVGPGLVTAGVDQYGNHRGYEWLRTWRYRPGDVWHSHVPPRLLRPQPGGTAIDVGAADPFFQEETAAAGLVFQHFAYATADQVAFKESYYGYDGAVQRWTALQQAGPGPHRLGDFFPWVGDAAVVERAEHAGIAPLARPDGTGAWSFVPPARPAAMAPAAHLLRGAGPGPRRRLLTGGPGAAPEIPADLVRRVAVVRLDGLAGVLRSSALLRELRRAFPLARVTVFAPDAEEALRACPYVNQRVNLPPLGGGAPDEALVAGLCAEVAQRFGGAFDLAINPGRDADAAAANRLMLATGAPLRLGHATGEAADALLTHVMPPGAAGGAAAAGTDPAATTAADAVAALALLGALNAGPHDPATEVWTTAEGEAAAAAALAAGPAARWRCLVGVPVGEDTGELAELCRRLAAPGDLALVLAGDGAARAGAARIVAALAGTAGAAACVDRVGALTVDAQCALALRCDLFVGAGAPLVDIAAAARLPLAAMGPRHGNPGAAAAEGAIRGWLAQRARSADVGREGL